MKVYFYEWSDVERKPLKFGTFDSFNTWCKAHNVEIPSTLKLASKIPVSLHVACGYNSNKAVAGISKTHLKMMLYE